MSVCHCFVDSVVSCNTEMKRKVASCCSEKLLGWVEITLKISEVVIVLRKSGYRFNKKYSIRKVVP